MELDRVFRLQQTSYWCGPAAVAVALSCRGVHVSQADLVTKLGTDIDGTDSSADVVRAMNGYLGLGVYEDVYVGGQDATATERAALAMDLMFSLDAGYALVANVRGTIATLDGSSYSYPGGHYVTVVGYRADGREVLIADIAVREYWTTTTRLATWIATRGYSRATLAAPTNTTGDDDVRFYRTPDGSIYREEGTAPDGLPILWPVHNPLAWEEYVSFGHAAREVAGVDWRWWRNGEEITNAGNSGPGAPFPEHTHEYKSTVGPFPVDGTTGPAV